MRNTHRLEITLEGVKGCDVKKDFSKAGGNHKGLLRKNELNLLDRKVQNRKGQCVRFGQADHLGRAAKIVETSPPGCAGTVWAFCFYGSASRGLYAREIEKIRLTTGQKKAGASLPGICAKFGPWPWEHIANVGKMPGSLASTATALIFSGESADLLSRCILKAGEGLGEPLRQNWQGLAGDWSRGKAGKGRVTTKPCPSPYLGLCFGGAFSVDEIN